MASNYPTSLDAFTTGTLTGIVSGSDHGNKADAINKIEAAIGAGVTNGRLKVVQEAPLNLTWPEYGGIGNDSTNNKAALDAAVTACPVKGGRIFLPRGQYRVSSLPAGIAHNGIEIIGEGINTTELRPSTSSGYLLDFSGSGYHVVTDLSIDGTLATGTACALRLQSAVTRGTFERVRIWNFTNTSDQFTTILEGALDNTFRNVEWENNSQHLRLRDDPAHTYPSNENVFDDCMFQTSQWASGNAILIEDSDANRFVNCLVQGNESLNTIGVINSTSGNVPARANVFDGMYLEDNGNAQVNSHGFHIGGANTGAQVLRATKIINSILFSTAHDKPGHQIYLENAIGTVISGNHSNLGSPNAAVTEGAGVTLTRLGPNDFAGTVAGFTANADTSGATLGALETEVNELKALLRARGLLAP